MRGANKKEKAMSKSKGRKVIQKRSRVLLKRPADLKKTKTSKKSKETSLSSEQLSEYIRTRAYYVWEEWGKPEGQDAQIWEQAEKDIKAQFKR